MSVGEFFDMGGYALYVWGSFGVTALAMVIEPYMVVARRKAILKQVSRRLRMKTDEREARDEG